MKSTMAGIGLAARQGGFNLVELMVAVVIGLIVSLVATVAYITGLETQTTQTDMARENEGARFAFMFLGAEIGKAGYHNGNGTFPGKPFGTMLGAPKISGNMVFAVDGDAGLSKDNNYSDTLRVSYFGDNSFDPADAGKDVGDGRILDCLGNAIQSDLRVMARIYVDADADNGGEPSLFCEPHYYPGPGSATIPDCATKTDADGAKYCPGVALVPGVEVLKLVYGVDDDDDGVVNRYMTIDKITGVVKDAILNVMPAIVMRTTGTAKDNPDAAAKTFHLLGASFEPALTDKGFAFTAPVDGRYRFAYNSVFVLRNNGEIGLTK